MKSDADLVRHVHQLYAVFESGMPDAADTILSQEPGLLGIGSDPAEWWVDAAVGAAFHAQGPEMKAAGIRFVAGDITAHSEGSVGWVADQPTLQLPDGNAIPMRMTAVWRREPDTWKMVQFHLSMGIPNEDALGTELTT